MTTDKQASTAITVLEPQQLLKAAIEKGSGIETLERLLALAKDVRAEQARSAWHDAVNEFRKTCPPIAKSKQARIMSRRTGTGFKYSYAPLDQIAAIVVPLLTPLGLGYRWHHRSEGDKMHISCQLSHRLGHSEDSGEIAVPIAADGDGASAAQRVGIAITYAKRYALLGILGISPEDDPDGGTGDNGDAEMPQAAIHYNEAAQYSAQVELERQAAYDNAKAEGKAYDDKQEHVVPMIRGKVKDMTTKTGSSARGPWTLYIVEMASGVEFTTFDSKHADFIRAAFNDGREVEIVWETNPKGKKSIVEVRTPTLVQR